MSKIKNPPGIQLHRMFGTSWYWTITNKRGRILIRSENYATKSAAIRDIKAVANHFENNQHYYDHSDVKDGIPTLVGYSLEF
jgi:hypothetical protein